MQDPGNLGTIIRLADWFGIGHIYCSHDCADAFSPKVIQATMGAIARVEVHYVDLIDFINNNSGTPIYGTFLDGEDIYEADLNQGGILLMGNEGKGISKNIERLVDKKLYIPSYPSNRETAESMSQLQQPSHVPNFADRPSNGINKIRPCISSSKQCCNIPKVYLKYCSFPP